MDRSRPSATPSTVVAETLQALEIDTAHSPQALEETSHWLADTGLDDPSLVDLTHLPFVTIDNADSRDLDQAMLIERHEEEQYRIRYALADAAYYVRPGSALFAEALERGATYYTPLMSVPMLPAALSEGLISLNPAVDRRALVFDMIVDENAIVSRTSIDRARIHSRAKLNYAAVQAWLDSDTTPARGYDESMLLLRELGNKLIAAAARRGVVRFDRSETQLRVTGDPPRFEAIRRARYQTERYNEQISLICNMQGAEILLALTGVTDALQAVFRVHEAPLKRSLGELRDTLAAFAQDQDLPALWTWEPGQSLAQYVESLPDAPQHKRRVMAVQRQIMQAQRASSFTPVPGEHHALKADSYARFSSPMREVVGIFTHKELLEALGGHEIDTNTDAALRDEVIDSANRARQRQRKLEKTLEFAALYSVFSRELALEEPRMHDGTVVGFRGDRVYVSLDDMAVDIKLYREDLEQQFSTAYTMNETAASPGDASQPAIRLGQAVQLCIRDYDQERRRFLFALCRVE